MENKPNKLLEGMWDRRVIEIEIRPDNRICGGIPTAEELIKAWILARMKGATAEEQAKLAAATLAELPAMTEAKAEGMWITFKVEKIKDAAGVITEGPIYIEARQIKSAFKESANVCREKFQQGEEKVVKPGKTKAEKPTAGKSRFTALKAKLAERLFVEGNKIFLLRDGKPVLKPDGSEERAIHVDTAQGPRSALKRVDFVSGPITIRFTIRWVSDKVVDNDLIEALLEHMSWNGIGADRSQGNGQFTVKSITTI